MITIGNQNFYNLVDVHQKTDISIRTLRRYCRAGNLTAVKRGKQWIISEENLQKFFQGGNPTKEEKEQ